MCAVGRYTPRGPALTWINLSHPVCSKIILNVDEKLYDSCFWDFLHCFEDEFQCLLCICVDDLCDETTICYREKPWWDYPWCYKRLILTTNVGDNMCLRHCVCLVKYIHFILYWISENEKLFILLLWHFCTLRETFPFNLFNNKKGTNVYMEVRFSY